MTEPSMTAQELYDHITKQIPAEKALLILLSDTIEVYDNLKSAKPLGDEKAVHPLYIVAAAAQDMGWDIMVEDSEVAPEVRGISIGTEEYFDALVPDIDKVLVDLYEHIKHGDEAHQQWLKDEFQKFKDGILTRNKLKS